MKAKSANHSTPPRTILLATVGMSPAVLTETVWALARPDEKRVEHVVPDDVVVITTKKGDEKIQELLLGKNGGWERLRSALEEKGIRVGGKLRFGSRSSIQLISTPDGQSDIEDLGTAEDNLEAANFFLRQIQHHIGETKEGSVRLYTSIAGGRKTMSALLFSCMSLLGREQDHILHVLVNEPFDNVKPPFLFPENLQRKVIDRKTGKTVRTVHDRDAVLSLIDIPFVKMRAAYEKHFGKGVPPTYRDLVFETQAAIEGALPTLLFDFIRGELFVEGDPRPVDLPTTGFFLLAALFLRHGKDSTELVHRACECEAPLCLRSIESWLQKYRWNTKNPYYDIRGIGVQLTPRDKDDRRNPMPEGFRSSQLNQIRTKLKRHPKLAGFVERIVPKYVQTIPQYGGIVKLGPGSEAIVDALFGPER